MSVSASLLLLFLSVLLCCYMCGQLDELLASGSPLPCSVIALLYFVYCTVTNIVDYHSVGTMESKLCAPSCHTPWKTRAPHTVSCPSPYQSLSQPGADSAVCVSR